MVNWGHILGIRYSEFAIALSCKCHTQRLSVRLASEYNGSVNWMQRELMLYRYSNYKSTYYIISSIFFFLFTFQLQFNAKTQPYVRLGT